MSPAVRSVCDLLGYDPLTLANEGKMVLVVAPERADAVVAALRETDCGREARRVGVVTAAHPGRVALAHELRHAPRARHARRRAAAAHLLTQRARRDHSGLESGMEPGRGLEPWTPSLPWRCSAELS